MNWPMVQLDRVTNISGGSTPRRNRTEYWNGDIPWVTPTDLPMPGSGIAEVFDTRDHITETGLRSCAANLLLARTVLFSSRATIGKIGIARVPLATNQGFANFTPKPGLNSKYLAYTLQYFNTQIAALASSTTFPEVRRGVLRKFKIPFPPLSEQYRIVEILDQADALRKKRAEADSKAARILPALFYKMFGDPSSNSFGYGVCELGQIADLQAGGTPPTKKKEYFGGNIPWITTVALGKIYIAALDANELITENAIRESATKLIPKNSLLLGTRVGVGKLSMNKCEICTNQDIAAIVLKNEGDFFIEYVFGVVRFYASFLVAQSRGATIKGITFDLVKRLRVPKAPRHRQEQFARHLRALHDWDLRSKQNGRRLGTLWKSLLHRAFSGDLTAKWREAHMKELLAEMEEQARYLESSH